ncbi:MAG TPA: V-type ATP synthase subunit E family protein [Actinomycetota bacterium]
MRREADEDLARIASETERKVEEVLGPARERAARAAEETRRSREAEACTEAERIRLSARARAATRLREAREEAHVRVLDRARGLLGAIRGSPGYPDILRGLVAEALGALPDARELHVDERDAALVQELGLVGADDVTVVPALRTWGGAVAAADGREVRNTLEERLERADVYLRPLVVEEIPEMATWREGETR